MLLANKRHTVGDVTQYFVSYWKSLRHGDWLVSAVVTANKPDVTIANTVILEGHTIQFTLSGGSLNETFTVTVQATDNKSGVSKDTVDFIVVEP